MKYSSYAALSSQAVTGTNAYNSDPVFIAHIFMASLEVIGTSTAAGTAKIQVSNDLGDPQEVPATFHWVDLPSASVALTAAATVLIPKFETSYQWMRVVYTNSAGSGNVTALVKGTGW